jgi:type IV secretory pathway TrbD component
MTANPSATPITTHTNLVSEDIVTPANRFMAAVAGQVLGIILLVLVGWLPFSVYSWMTPEQQNVILVGLSMVKYTMVGVLFTLIIASIPAIRFRNRHRTLKGLDEAYVTCVMWLFLLADMFFLLFLVCQQGGLCFSVFIPVFFLLPIAYATVERSDKKYRVYWVFIIVVVCVLLSYLHSKLITHHGLRVMPLIGVPITNFQGIVHNDYDEALLIVSIVSAAIPFAQLFFLKVRFRSPRLSSVRRHIGVFIGLYDHRDAESDLTSEVARISRGATRLATEVENVRAMAAELTAEVEKVTILTEKLATDIGGINPAK